MAASFHRRPSPPDSRAEAGRRAEDQALAHLRAQGLTLLARNFRCRGGELDLVMQDGAILVFVEVRLRRSNAFGDGAATVTRAKQLKLLHAARAFLAGTRIDARTAEPVCRFDVVSVSTPNYALHWIKDAFTQDG